MNNSTRLHPEEKSTGNLQAPSTPLPQQTETSGAEAGMVTTAGGGWSPAPAAARGKRAAGEDEQPTPTTVAGSPLERRIEVEQQLAALEEIRDDGDDAARIKRVDDLGEDAGAAQNEAGEPGNQTHKVTARREGVRGACAEGRNNENLGEEEGGSLKSSSSRQRGEAAASDEQQQQQQLTVDLRRELCSQNLFVFHLPSEWRESHLTEAFSRFGEILSVKVVKRPDMTSKGYGFVCFESSESAVRAVEEMDGYAVCGKRLKVSLKKTPEECLSMRVEELMRKAEADEDYDRERDCSLFVFHLPPQWDDFDLKERFSKFGPVVAAKVSRKEDGTSRGYGFVTCGDPKAAAVAIMQLNGFEVCNKRLKVQPKQMGGNGHPRPDCTVFVFHVPNDWNDSNLRQFFSSCGRVKSATVQRDQKGRSRGYGFVTYEQPQCARDAVAELNGTPVGTKRLKVSLKRLPQPPRYGSQQGGHPQQGGASNGGPAAAAGQSLSPVHPTFHAQHQHGGPGGHGPHGHGHGHSHHGHGHGHHQHQHGGGSGGAQYQPRQHHSAATGHYESAAGGELMMQGGPPAVTSHNAPPRGGRVPYPAQGGGQVATAPHPHLLGGYPSRAADAAPGGPAQAAAARLHQQQVARAMAAAAANHHQQQQQYYAAAAGAWKAAAAQAAGGTPPEGGKADPFSAAAPHRHHIHAPADYGLMTAAAADPQLQHHLAAYYQQQPQAQPAPLWSPTGAPGHHQQRHPYPTTHPSLAGAEKQTPNVRDATGTPAGTPAGGLLPGYPQHLATPTTATSPPPITPGDQRI